MSTVVAMIFVKLFTFSMPPFTELKNMIITVSTTQDVVQNSQINVGEMVH